NGTTPRVEVTVDVDDNRSAVDYDPSSIRLLTTPFVPTPFALARWQAARSSHPNHRLLMAPSSFGWTTHQDRPWKRPITFSGACCHATAPPTGPCRAWIGPARIILWPCPKVLPHPSRA